MGGLAKSFGWGGTAASAAAGSTGWGLASTGLSAAGSLFEGIGASQSAGYAAQVALNNAALMRANAQATSDAGRYQESMAKTKYGLLQGEQLAAQGANNIDVAIGSPAAVRQSTADVGAMDAALIHYNAARAAYGQQAEARSLQAQAALDRRAGARALTAGLLGSASSLIGGASSLGAKWSAYKLSFPGKGAADPSTDPAQSGWLGA